MKHDTIPFHRLSMKDLQQVGGKNASLGERINKLSHLGINVPDGFAAKVDAFNKVINL
ncbi:MAG TPA: PEP/pyruvate-binding domain-containing protein [Chryseolinea sp.]